ncbi:tubulin-like doman-containing protein [Streptomyces sp. NPDC002685]|uniref:tubulin-like doman-containing protein n=1 Tax=Streptomyces sp. NPDC002685 TaxID=3154540 RepID=UPI003318EDC2
MTVERLLGALAGADIEASPTEVAEALWLAARIEAQQGSEPPPGLPSSTDATEPAAASKAPTSSPAEPLPSGPEPPAGPDAVAPPPEPPPAPGDLYAARPRDTAGSGPVVPAVAVRAPAAAALPGGLDLLRALRPLKRNVASTRHVIVDEQATADRIAEEQVVLPRLLPAPERWLSLVIVVDGGPSMLVWHSLVQELRTLMEGLGAFRDIRVWHLQQGNDGRLGIRSRALSSAPLHDPRELIDPSGRQAVWVVSDCIDGTWRSGEADRVLGLWGRKGPLAVLQPLPQRLWHRSGVRPVSARIHAGEPGIPNPRLRVEHHDLLPGSPPPQGMPVPVLEIEPAWLKSWARLVTGTAYGGVDGMVALVGPGRPRSNDRPEPAWPTTSSVREPTSPIELVKRFRATASPEAFRLAGYFAAVPLTLPVMRLVQRVMVRSPRPAHLAEVFVSGLLMRQNEAGSLEEASYDFVAGVRDVLLGTMRASEMRQVCEEVSRYVGARMGHTRDTAALLRLPWGSGHHSLGVEERPFAGLPPEVLRRLGFTQDLTEEQGLTEEQDLTAGPSTRSAEEAPSPPAEPPSEDETSGQDDQVDPRPRMPARTFTMRTPPTPVSKVFQPMLFVGLGGVGCQIGAELEAGFRRALCGPDGRALGGHPGMVPHQLPNVLQFVYADFSQSELAGLPHLSVENSLRPAYAGTARATHDLLPEPDSSPEITRLLRLTMRDEVQDWLPPNVNEPRVTPLRFGAGQLPTVGRAALFGTLRHGLDPVMGPLLEAVDSIGRSVAEIRDLGGGRNFGCDVFVAFSVAGGTGAGIFLDYLHLIGEAFRVKGFPGARIHPLVVMPSAFPASAGGGREADLNAARALVDLFHLVDEQNAPADEHDLDSDLSDPPRGIRYPGNAYPIRLRPATVPTAFLFSGTAGIHQDDLRSSVVSLVMSLVGTEPSGGSGANVFRTDDHPTFSRSFVDHGLHRGMRTSSGIGARGASTSLVASMTTPVDELAEMFSTRLLAASVRRLSGPVARPYHEYASIIRQTFIDSGLGDLWNRGSLPVPEPDPVPRGGAAIEQVLRDRIAEMEILLRDLEHRVTRRAPILAEQFAPRVTVERLLHRMDPFQVEQILNGVPGDRDPVTALGFLGMLDNRSREPARPPGVEAHPPLVSRIQRRLGGLSRPRWGDDEVVAALEEQDRWYRWRSGTIWHQAWRAQRERWRPALTAAHEELTRLVDAFREHADHEPRAFAEYVQQLYGDRSGVAFLLPPQRNLDAFYDDLRVRLTERADLRDGDDEALLPMKLIDGDRWQAAYTMGRRNPRSAVDAVKTVLAEQIRTLLQERATPTRRRPLLPSMATLLRVAAGVENATEEVSKGAVEQFGLKLAALLPHGFVPDGTGPLKILVRHPHVGTKNAAEEYLRRILRLPGNGVGSIEFRGEDTDSITVVLLRSEMSLNDVPEVRKVLRQWVRATDDERAEDMLRWRQRLGYRDNWPTSTETDRRYILHHLLCAMWNGQVDVVEGDVASPRSVRVRLQADSRNDGPGVTLRLDGYAAGVSAWVGLLRAYERWVLLDEADVTEAYGGVLMATRPEGLTTAPVSPSRLFMTLVHEVAPSQVTLLDGLARESGRADDSWLVPLRHFWENTFPSALDLPFSGSGPFLAGNLRDLDRGQSRGWSGPVR